MYILLILFFHILQLLFYWTFVLSWLSIFYVIVYIYSSKLLIYPYPPFPFVLSYSIVSDSLWPHGLWPNRLFCPWILQARILEWVIIPFSRESSGPNDWTQVSCISGRFFTIWATRETLNGNHKFVFYVRESVSGLVNKFSCVTFSNSSYVWYPIIFVSLYLTFFT